MTQSVLDRIEFLIKSKTNPRLILGLMSGTSLDGLDLALCEISGCNANTKLQVIHFESVTYTDQFLERVKPLFANANAKLADVCSANAFIAREHASIVLHTLEKWQVLSEQIDLIASHGQTIFHAPKSLEILATKSATKTMVTSTMQLGDGDHLAYLTGITTMSDFRQKHVAANGEGAPLVPYADFLLFTSAYEPRVLLNIGGIANFTYLPQNARFTDVKSADTGPGNTLMDELIQYALNAGLAAQYPEQKPYDENGQLAASGLVNQQLLQVLLSYTDTYKGTCSTGQEVYNLAFVELALADLSGTEQDGSLLPIDQEGLANLLATLNMFSAMLISQSLAKLDLPSNTAIYVSGGGTHNKQLMQNILECVDGFSVHTIEKLGMSSDAKEAALFAVLANQSLYGDYQIFANKNDMPATSLGKLSFP